MNKIEDAAKDHFFKIHGDYDNVLFHKVAFIAGAEWQKEQDLIQINNLKTYKINLEKIVEELEDQLIEAGLKKRAITIDLSHNA